MANSLKVNKEKKMEIVQYCIDHDHDNICSSFTRK